MMFLYLVAVVVSLVGHFAICVTIHNRLHAISGPQWVLHGGSLIALAMLPFVPAGMYLWFILGGDAVWPRGVFAALASPLGYLPVCWLAALVIVPHWIIWERRAQQRNAAVTNRSEVVDIRQRVGSSPLTAGTSRLFAWIPRNEVFEPIIQTKEVELARLDPRHDGLKILHLSDLHMGKHIEPAFFEAMVDVCNEQQADLVLVTGDIIEKRHALEWLDDTLARLQAPQGIFYILGNHDARLDTSEIRGRLNKLGLIDLGGRWQRITIAGADLVLAGNELPWQTPAADLSAAPPRDESGLPTRLLLSHSPDQIAWAQARDIDFMLAGHTHGGQIKLPLLGPVVSPSKYGVKYTDGLFREGPTVMHVTRGVSGADPIRLNCPPEISVLVLRKDSS